jgi:hypothetical protein
MIQTIPTISDKIKLIRDSDSTTFRPSAIGLIDDESLTDRLNMERQEVLYQRRTALSSLACAAHFTESEAIRGARNELIERISLAAWWRYRRPIINNVDSSEFAELLNLPKDFSYATFIVPSSDRDSFVAGSILSNKLMFPYYAFGGGSNASEQDAVQHALLESIQSWSATVWLRRNHQQFPYWDQSELAHRFEEAEQLSSDNKLSDSKPFVANIGKIATLTITRNAPAVIASYNTARPFSGSAKEYARLVKLPWEADRVLTEYNY